MRSRRGMSRRHNDGDDSLEDWHGGEPTEFNGMLKYRNGISA